MKRIFAMVLALTLLLAPAAVAADVSALFPATRTAVSFPDVAVGAWYESAAKICYETGLLNGTGSGFSPAGTVTIAEAATLAARIHDLLSGGTGVLPTSEPWYRSAVEHMAELGISGLDNPNQAATRQDFFILLSVVLTAEHLAPINQITTLPDVDDEMVLTFYNAGILTGIDGYGTFSGGGTLTRAEMAAMAARIARPALRISFTPETAPKVNPADGQSLTLAGLGIAPEATIATVNGVPIAAQDFVFALCNDIYSTEAEQYETYGQLLDWTYEYNVGYLSDYFKSRAMGAAVSNELIRQKCAAQGITLSPAQEQTVADQLARQRAEYDSEAEFLRALAYYNGCTYEGYERFLRTDLLDDMLFAAATHAQLSSYAAEYDILRAKHILVEDLTMAEIFLEVIDATPTEAQFDELMNQYSIDGGLAQNPNGYLFTANQFVPEFEAATRALKMGEHSGLVQSTHGYHIILRLDPAADPALREYYRNDMLGVWQSEAELSVSPAYHALDCADFYQIWMEFINAY